jgi:hypothetical protein
MRELIINAALTGVVPRRADNPHVPITESEIVADAVRCVDAGAIDPARKLSMVRAFLIGAMNSSLEWFDPGKAPIDDIAAELTSVFLDGLRPRATARKAQRPSAPARKGQRP